jgi:hypothetical protein
LSTGSSNLHDDVPLNLAFLHILPSKAAKSEVSDENVNSLTASFNRLSCRLANVMYGAVQMQPKGTFSISVFKLEILARSGVRVPRQDYTKLEI